MKVQGSLIIKTAADAEKYAGVTSVGGSLYARADFQAPALTSVGGSLYVRADFQAPALTSVGGDLYVSADFQAPALNAQMLADDGNYQLWFFDGVYRAGCRKFTREQALVHWQRTDDRAVLFRAAILKFQEPQA